MNSEKKFTDFSIRAILSEDFATAAAKPADGCYLDCDCRDCFYNGMYNGVPLYCNQSSLNWLLYDRFCQQLFQAEEAKSLDLTFKPFGSEEKVIKREMTKDKLNLNQAINYNTNEISNSNANKTKKRNRMNYTKKQVAMLQDAYARNKYLYPVETERLAQKVGLTPAQVKVWFQNRRTKQKLTKSSLNANIRNHN